MLLRDQDVGEGRRELSFLTPQQIFESVFSCWSSYRAPPEDEAGVYWNRLDDGRCSLIGCVLPWSVCDREMESLTLFEMYQMNFISEEVYSLFKELNKIEYTYEPEQWPTQLIYLGHKNGYLGKEQRYGEKQKEGNEAITPA